MGKGDHGHWKAVIKAGPGPPASRAHPLVGAGGTCRYRREDVAMGARSPGDSPSGSRYDISRVSGLRAISLQRLAPFLSPFRWLATTKATDPSGATPALSAIPLSGRPFAWPISPVCRSTLATQPCWERLSSPLSPRKANRFFPAPTRKLLPEEPRSGRALPISITLVQRSSSWQSKQKASA